MIFTIHAALPGIGCFLAARDILSPLVRLYIVFWFFRFKVNLEQTKALKYYLVIISIARFAVVFLVSAGFFLCLLFLICRSVLSQC